MFSKKKKSLIGNVSRRILLGLSLWVSSSEVALSQSLESKWAIFQEEARAIAQPLQVPGGVMGLMVGDSLVALSAWGWANIARQIPMRSDHLFPIASISKTFAAVRALQLVAEGKLSLQTPARQYLPSYGLPETVRIHHLFQQTSEGIPGHFFAYGSRFGWLTEVIEKAGKQKYTDQMQAHLLSPLQMQQTIPGVGAVGYAHLAARIASPYFFNPVGLARPGYLPPPGLKSSTGLVATVEDLARYTRGLLQHLLLPDSLQKKMWQPALTLSGDTLMYGLGWFVGKVADAPVYWHYGQEDCYSSVLMHLPQQKLTLLMLANSASLSDHGRMLDGNFRRSLFLWSFLRHFVIPAGPVSWPEVSAPAQAWDTFLPLCPDSLRWVAREEMMARLMWHFYTEASPKSNSLAYAYGLVKHFSPDLDSQADPALAWVWLRLLDSPAPALLPSAEKIVFNTLAAQPQDPYRQYLKGWFYQIVGEKNQASPYFQAVADLPNFDLRWYKVLATYQAGENLLATQPDLARRYLQRVIAWGWNLDGVCQKAIQALKQ